MIHKSAVQQALSTQPTPFYWYDLDIFRQTLNQCKRAADRYGFEVHYALKANFNPLILREIAALGFGADCVSGGEIQAALGAGFRAEKIVFAGVGKLDKEIALGLDQKIFCFNAESTQELEVIQSLAAQRESHAPIAIRINPDVDAGTHHYITTGMAENKFGIHTQSIPEIIRLVKSSKNVDLIGLHVHIGSLINDLEVFKRLCIKVNDFVRYFRSEGIEFSVLNMGGGLGIDYFAPDQHPIPDFAAYFTIFHRFLDRSPGQEIHFELGRALVAQCGSLITQVTYVKDGAHTDFLIVDAGMNDLLRPALYQAYHTIENLSDQGDPLRPRKTYDVVGPICESGDFFRKGVELPTTQRGDFLAIRSVGAYGEVMSSPYNLRPKAQAVYG